MLRVQLVWCFFCLVSAGGTVAYGQTLEGSGIGVSQPVQWHCEPMQVPGELWVMRCEDYQAQLDYDPALSDGPSNLTWYVPTWSLPIDPQMTMQLIRAALCRGKPCGVSLRQNNRQPVSMVWAVPSSLR